MRIKRIFSLICAGSFLVGVVHAESSVTVTLAARTEARKNTIPEDYVGLSFGMRALAPNSTGGHFFSSTNKPLITLFKNVGIHHLRMGGTTVESPPSTPIPGKVEIDEFFSFVRAAGVKKVIYSLRLLETNSTLNYAETNAAIAKYIWKKYRSHLDRFAIGNEPDLQRVFGQDFIIRDFRTYIDKWRMFAKTITNAVPEAKFAGPDAGSGNIDWTIKFADAEKGSGLVTLITEHFYVGGKGRGVEARDGIESILSRDWIAANEKIYNRVTVPVLAKGFSFRFTEANDHYSGGIPDASNTFAGALWALDFLHWWAAHDAIGVNFHNTQWVVNDVITPDANGQLMVNPKGYGIKAFNLGSQGSSELATVSNPDNINLTAYSVLGAKQHFVTLINKEHGVGAREAKVTILANGISRRAEVMYLTAPNGDVAAKIGVTLGGDAISNRSKWNGKWTSLKSDKAGQCVVKVPAASAAIVKLPF